MIRVYLDWNIFSYLRQFRESKEPYISLNRYLTQNNHSVLIPYTSAHLTDLIPSYTGSEKGKIETECDLEYLAALTNHNCILYDYKEKRTYCDRYDLREYFEQLLEGDALKYNSIESLFSTFNDLGLGDLSKSFIDLLKVLPTGIDPELFGRHQTTSSPLMSIFEKTLKGGSFYEVMSETMHMLSEYNNNHKAYRGIRNASLDELKLNFNYSTSGDPIEEISSHLQSSTFKQSFKEFTEAGLKNYFGDKEPSRFDAFTTTYIFLDFLGYYKDQRFKNLTQDSFHAYYGAHCDFFVTDDRNTYHKAKVIYSHFNIDTVVCTSSEFNSKFFGKVILNPTNELPLMKTIPQIISTAFVAAKKHDENFNPVDVYHFDYFLQEYFNRLQVTHNINGCYSLFLYKKSQNYSRFYFSDEIETIANKIVTQFGMDKHLKAEINLDEKRKDMGGGSWNGRHWDFGEVLIWLKLDKEFGLMLQMDIHSM